MLKYFLFSSLWFFCLVSNAVFAEEETEDTGNKTLEEAESCTQIEQKIQRLTCFDTVFSTPIYGVKYNSDKPKDWVRATDSELKRESGKAPLLTVDETKPDMWVTIPATNVKGKRMPPLLVLSCISGISRVEFALYHSLNKGRVKVSFADGVEELWRSDDSGLLLSSRRGGVAKAHVQAIMKKKELVIRSDSPLVDGLEFSTVGLDKILSPVRERCGW